MTADTSRKGFLMSLNEDIRKTLTDPTPLYFAAGVLDKIREEAPSALAAVRSTDPKEVQAKVTDRARDTQARVNKTLGGIDADIKKLREQTQSLALQGLGFAAEYAVKAREAYGELAERGRGAVQNWRSEDEDTPEITVERQAARVAEPPKHERTSAARPSRKPATGGASRTGSATGPGSATGTSGTGSTSGTGRNSTARNTSAKSAAVKSTDTQGTNGKVANGKNANTKSTAPKGGTQKSAASRKPAGGGNTTPKSDS